MNFLRYFALAAVGCGLCCGQLQADDVLKASVKLQTPKKESKRAPQPLDEVPLNLWLPADTKVVRGLIVNPFYEKAVGQQHWQAAARHWGFGILGANYFGVRNAEFGPTLLQGLSEFAKTSGHRELEHVPCCFVGMSAGAGMSTRFAEQLPDRTIAVGPVCLEVGPQNEASMHIPMVTVFGERDGKQMEKLLAKLPEQRRQAAQWSIAVQWRRRHEFARANNMVMPLFDHAIRIRYPDEATPVDGPVKLNPIDESSGWLGQVSTWTRPAPAIAAYDKFAGDKSAACWFPDAYVAHVWQAFVVQAPRLSIQQPAGQGDGDFHLHAAGRPIHVELKIAAGLKPQQVQLFDGDRPLGKFEGNQFTLELKPGIYTLIAVATTESGEKSISHPNTIIMAAE